MQCAKIINDQGNSDEYWEQDFTFKLLELANWPELRMARREGSSKQLLEGVRGQML